MPHDALDAAMFSAVKYRTLWHVDVVRRQGAKTCRKSVAHFRTRSISAAGELVFFLPISAEVRLRRSNKKRGLFDSSVFFFFLFFFRLPLFCTFQTRYDGSEEKL